MAALSLQRPRLAVVIAVISVIAAVSACGGQPAPAPAPRPSASASASRTPADLSAVLIQPPGFDAVPGDTISGPLRTADDVINFFTDRPRDPIEILGHGFSGGYVRAWQLHRIPPTSGTAVPASVILTEVVIQFDTPAHAVAVEQYFRQAPPIAPTTAFAVPSQLDLGYGQYQVQGSGSTASYLDAVVWVIRNQVFDIGIEYPAPRKSAAQVIAVALAQDQDQTGS
jgi:hypothetical protein